MPCRGRQAVVSPPGSGRDPSDENPERTDRVAASSCGGLGGPAYTAVELDREGLSHMVRGRDCAASASGRDAEYARADLSEWRGDVFAPREAESSRRTRGRVASIGYTETRVGRNEMVPPDLIRPDRRWSDALVSRRGVPAASSSGVRRMQNTKRRDTRPERALRSELHRRGFRFFVDRAPLPGVRRRGDILFPRARVAVYIDGCFWHGRPDHGTWPKANAAWWRDKITANQVRDRDTDDELRAAGWTPVRVWEHESPIEAADRVAAAVEATRIGPN